MKLTNLILTNLVLQMVLATMTLQLSAAPPQAPTLADVSHGPHSLQIMDLYLPKEGDGPFPVLIWYRGIWKPSKHVPDPNRFCIMSSLTIWQKPGLNSPKSIVGKTSRSLYQPEIHLENASNGESMRLEIEIVVQ